MNNCYSRLEENKLFISLFIGAILCIGLVYSILPHFVRYETLKNEGLQYIPVTINSNFDHMNHYGTRYRDVVDGTLIPGEIDTYEHKDGPILFPMLDPAILSPFFLPFDSIFPGMIITDFLFPILLFVAIYFILFELTRQKFYSLFSAYMLMIFPQLPVLIPPSSLAEIKILLYQFVPFSEMPASGLNFLTRGSFIPGGPFYISMFYFVYRALTTETKKRIFIVLGGVFYGLLFYLYLFFWIFATIFLGILILTFLITKNYSHARTIFFIGLTGAVVSIPFWINQYNLTNLPSYQDIIVRMGIEEGRGIRWFLWKTYTLHLFLAMLAVYIGRMTSKAVLGYFLASIALTGIIAYNMNVVVGWTILSDHWGNKVFLLTNGIVLPPLFYYSWTLLAPFFKKKYFFERLSRILPVFATILVILLTVKVVYSEIKEGVKNAHDYTVPIGQMAAYKWLTENTPKDSVVMTPSIETNIELAAYTHNRVFQARAQDNILSKSEVLERLYITYNFFDIPQERFYEIIKSKLGVFIFFTEEYNSRALDSHLRPDNYPSYELPQGIAEDLLDKYANFTAPKEIPYRVDFIFIGPRERGLNANEKILAQYEKMYDNEDIAIYKYKHE